MIDTDNNIVYADILPFGHAGFDGHALVRRLFRLRLGYKKGRGNTESHD
ncbi:MAG: hypothetical protein HY811_11650 [Planctomycetes bacterium]|nr:hypothetical protein [Planctomycetota bacterium]